MSDDLLRRLRVASPCTVAWEGMTGDERVRFCTQCSLHVYNISEMTAGEVRSLIADSGGRFCGRLYRRADGTVITRDCPTGLRAVRRRASRAAGAVLTAALSLCSAALGQKSAPPRQACRQPSWLTILKTPPSAGAAPFAGTVRDPNGAGVAGTQVTLTNELTKERHAAATDEKGEFAFPRLAPGKYTVGVAAAFGLKPFLQKHVCVDAGESLRAEITLDIAAPAVEVLVGNIGVDPVSEGNGTRRFKSEEIQKLPYGD